MVANEIKVSKFLSYVLRHKPDSIGLTMSENGWVSIDELIRKSDVNLSISIIKNVVKNIDKQRFHISEDGLRIRANQGHSIDVNLEHSEAKPPKILYHGTATRFLSSILQNGLKPQSRTHVHLSADVETARQVGKRHGKPIILTINSSTMYDSGEKFYFSRNKVWLTKNVKPKFIAIYAE